MGPRKQHPGQPPETTNDRPPTGLTADGPGDQSFAASRPFSRPGAVMRLWRRRSALALGALVATGAAALPFVWHENTASAIVGGTRIQPGQYPWLVNVIGDMGDGWYVDCTGVLVSPRHVVAAAHCTPRNPNGNYSASVKFGLASPPMRGMRIRARPLLRHPSAVQNASLADVAVWTLEKPVRVPAIALVGRGVTGFYKPGTKLLMAGYGENDDGWNDPQQAVMTVMPSCRSAAVWVCATTGRRDWGARAGDSGAPLFVKSGSGHVLVGVAGNHNADKHWFARIALPQMNDWLRKTTK